MQIDPREYRAQFESFIDRVVQSKSFDKVLQSSLSLNQESIVQGHLERKYTDLAVGRLVWQKKAQEAIEMSHQIDLNRGVGNSKDQLRKKCIDSLKSMIVS